MWGITHGSNCVAFYPYKVTANLTRIFHGYSNGQSYSLSNTVKSPWLISVTQSPSKLPGADFLFHCFRIAFFIAAALLLHIHVHFVFLTLCRIMVKHDMMTSSNGNIFRVTGPLCGEFTGHRQFFAQRPVTRSFDVFYDLRLNKRLSKQRWGWWFETPSCPLWRHCNELLRTKPYWLTFIFLLRVFWTILSTLVLGLKLVAVSKSINPEIV